jgi:TP901 family phage tail tape measure protein
MTAAFLGELYATMSVNTSALDHGIVAMRRFEQQANASLLRIQKNWEKTGAAMKTFGRSMTQFVTVPMALVGGASMKMYADFEFSMNKVVSLVGVARDQVDEWSASILDLAPSLGKSPRELADAMYFITSAGIRGAEAMDILEESAKSSAAGLGETKVIADLLTSAMNAYGKENLSAARANDILVATVREGKAEANLLAQSLGLVLPIASAMGAEFTDVGAATAAMTRTGTKAATAAIQLRQLFNSILKPAKEAEQALVDMGISSEQLRKIIDEGSLLDALKKLDEVTKEYGVAAVGKVIPNIRSLTGFLDIMGKNVDANEKLWGSIEDSMGDAERTFQQTADTVRFRMAVAFSRVTTSATRFGETMAKVLVPIMEKVAIFIEKVTKRFEALSTGQKVLIGRIGLVVAALGPFITILGFLVGNVVPGLIMVMRGATKAITFLGVAIKNNPVGALITVVTTLVSLYAMWKSRANEVAKAQMTLNKVTEEATKNVASERVAMDQLFRIAKDVNRSEKERLAAIEAINSASPELLGNINLENIGLASATKAKEKYIAGLLREAKVKAVMAELNALEIEYLEQVTKKGAAVLTFWQKLAKFATAGAMTMEERESFIKSMEELNMEKAKSGLDATRKELEKLLDEIVKVEDFQTVFDGGVGDDEKNRALAVATALENYSQEVAFAADMQEIFGKSFDYANHMLSASQQALEAYLRAGVDPLDARIVKLSKDIFEFEAALHEGKGLKAFAEDTAKAHKELQKIEDLKFADMMVAWMGDMQKEGAKLTEEIDELTLSFYGLDRASKQLLTGFKAAARNIDDYVRAGLISKKDAALKTFQLFKDAYESAFESNAPIGQLMDLKAGMEDAYEALTPFQKIQVWAENNIEGIRAVGQAFGQLWNSIGQYLSANMERELAMIDEIAKRKHKSDEWVAREREKIEKEYAKKFKQQAIAEAIMNTAIGVTKAFATLAAPWSFITAGLVAAAGAIQIAAIRATPMAKGGIVPPGYPNDTFPALLTSGEKIIPAHKPFRASMNPELVEFRIDGDQLVGILKKQESVNANY